MVISSHIRGHDTREEESFAVAADKTTQPAATVTRAHGSRAILRANKINNIPMVVLEEIAVVMVAAWAWLIVKEDLPLAIVGIKDLQYFSLVKKQSTSVVSS